MGINGIIDVGRFSFILRRPWPIAYFGTTTILTTSLILLLSFYRRYHHSSTLRDFRLGQHVAGIQ